MFVVVKAVRVVFGVVCVVVGAMVVAFEVVAEVVVLKS